MAWLALALQRSDRQLRDRPRRRDPPADRRDPDRLVRPTEGGGIPWRRGDVFKNTPANGPAAILLARTGHLDRAAATADWIDRRLRDPATGLIWDGLRPGRRRHDPSSRRRSTPTARAWCWAPNSNWRQRLPAHGRSPSARIAPAGGSGRARDLSTDGVLTGHGGGDSGLFSRHPGPLPGARSRCDLPGTTAATGRPAGGRRRLVARRRPTAAWANAGARSTACRSSAPTGPGRPGVPTSRGAGTGA